jgi:SpoIIAA-like
MLTGAPIPDTNIFEITFSGGLDLKTFEKLRDELAAFLDSHQPADILANYGHIELTKIMPKALWEDLKSAGLEKKVRRAAIVTEDGWLATLAKGASVFIQAEVKTFGLDERDAALAWLQR